MDFNHFGQNKTKKKKKVASTDSFIEALKGIGGGVVNAVKEDVIKGTAQNAFDTILGSTDPQSSGEITPGGSVDFDQLQREQAEQQKASIEHRRLHNLRHKEETIFSAQQEQIKREIKHTQEELKKLAADMSNVAREVQIATIQEVADPGQYHVGFFEHLQRIIRTLRKKLSDSGSWLQSANNRASRKKGYWGKVKSHGTKFMLSEERRSATQSG